MFHTRFLSPTDQKCAESSTYWQFFYYRPPGKFRFTHLGEIVRMLCQELDIYICNMIIDMDFLYQFNLGLIGPLFTGSFHEMFEKKNFFLNFQKLAVLWLVGKVANHVAIYGSKVAEGFLAFQHRSCSILQVCSVALRECIYVAHFTDHFSMVIQLCSKFGFTLNPFQVIISLQNFAYSTRAQLSCHEQHLVSIAGIELWWKQNDISVEFELWWKNHWSKDHLA